MKGDKIAVNWLLAVHFQPEALHITILEVLVDSE